MTLIDAGRAPALPETIDRRATRRLSVVPVITTLGRSGPVAATGRAARATGRVTARAGWTAGQGSANWARRAAQAATHGHLREQIRLARLSADREGIAEWTERLEKAKDARQRRLLALPWAVLAVLVVALAVAVVAGVLALIGAVTVQLAPGGLDWSEWWAGIGRGLDIAGAVLQALVVAAVVGGPPLVLFLAWREGQRAGQAPAWLQTPTERAQAGAEITADAIAGALLHMKIPALTKYLKEGGRLEFLVAPREQGGGTYCQVRLPLGVRAAELLKPDKVELLAGNLSRHKHETWPQRAASTETDGRVLDLWTADKGALDRPAPPWPLLVEGTFDVFRDRLPWGVTMRREQVAPGMLQKHWLIGATSKQGKTTALRLLLLGLALDPTVELRIADLKGDGDFSMFRGLATTLIEGNTDEHAEATCAMLEEAVREMQRRYDRKRAIEHVGPITREMSRRKGADWHPIWVVVDECQVLYAAGKDADGTPIGGSSDDARAWKAAKRLHDQARAVNIHLMQATQRPDDRTLPVRVREGAHVRASLNVPNESAARMILAEAADRGARPQDLRPGADAGTVVAAGELEDIPKGQAFIIIRTHYVSTEDAYKVTQRAIAVRKRAGWDTLAPVELEAAPEPVDHLQNILDALRGESRVRTQVVLQRLAEHDAGTYEGWGFGELGEALAEHELEAAKSNGLKVVRLEDVERAVAERDRP